MGLASPRPPSLARESLTSSKLILATPSMSQGFHQGSNIFSFSDEFHERPQQHHLAQQSRRDKLIRPVQGFFEVDSTAVAAISAGNPLQAPMEEEEEEEEEEVPGIYGAAPPTAGANNILPEMFNFPGAPADLLSCQNSPPAGYHRFQQRPAAGFLDAADSWPYAGSRQGLVMDNTGNWGSLEDAAAAAVGKQHGDINPDSSTAMRLFFMNPQSSAASRAPQAVSGHHQYERHHRPPNSPPEVELHDIGAAAAVAAAIAPLHHPQASHHSQAFLGAGGAAYVFGGTGGGGSVMDTTQGLSLSLSSSLRQFEIMSKADQELGSVREAASGTLFFDSQLHHHEQAQQHDHHELLAAGHRLEIIRQGQQQQQHQQQVHMVMSYGGGVNGGGPGPGGTAGVINVLRNSKYARAAQELLEEFCSVGRGGQFQLRSGNRTARASSSNPNTSSGHAGGGGASTSAAAAAAVSSSSSKDILPPLSPADRFENQRKKSKLLSILEEVEKRYNHYCSQMQMVVNSFDSMMGLGAATPYTALAQKAMSRHFRCLKDAVAAQLRGTCELLGEKDGGAGSGSGLTKGETPRLRLIDQNLRHQRAFHQMGMMEQEAWRPQRGLPDRSVNVLRAWLFEHFLHPYPSDADKHLLARQTGLSRNQVSNWFINARVRLWKPMVEEMYQQEAKEEDDEEEEDLQHSNKLEEETANSRTLASASMQQQQQAHDQTRQQSPESHAAPENDPSSTPIPRISQPRQADDAAAAVIFAPALDDGMYGRPAAVLGPSSTAQLMFRSAAASARGSGDLSLTLGLRHAGGNAPETGRFGL